MIGYLLLDTGAAPDQINNPLDADFLLKRLLFTVYIKPEYLCYFGKAPFYSLTAVASLEPSRYFGTRKGGPCPQCQC